MDRREYHLGVTQKHIDDDNISAKHMVEVMDRISGRLSPGDCRKLEEMLVIISREPMPGEQIPEIRLQDAAQK